LCQVLDQLKEDVDKLKKRKNSTTTLTANPETTDQLVNKLNENLKNPVTENFQFHLTHKIQCTQ
jgi:hypothetical protein